MNELGFCDKAPKSPERPNALPHAKWSECVNWYPEQKQTELKEDLKIDAEQLGICRTFPDFPHGLGSRCVGWKPVEKEQKQTEPEVKGFCRGFSGKHFKREDCIDWVPEEEEASKTEQKLNLKEDLKMGICAKHPFLHAEYVRCVNFQKPTEPIWGFCDQANYLHKRVSTCSNFRQQIRSSTKPSTEGVCIEAPIEGRNMRNLLDLIEDMLDSGEVVEVAYTTNEINIRLPGSTNRAKECSEFIEELDKPSSISEQILDSNHMLNRTKEIHAGFVGEGRSQGKSKESVQR